MSSELFHLEKPAGEKDLDYADSPDSWISAMPNYDDEIEFDEDSPELDEEFFHNAVHRINGRIVPQRKSPTDPIDPEVQAFMKSITPLIQMEPDILGGMPVFKNTLVPVKRMFDYLLAGKPLGDFLADYPTVSNDTAIGVLENDATLFYEAISKALDSTATPSSSLSK